MHQQANGKQRKENQQSVARIVNKMALDVLAEHKSNKVAHEVVRDNLREMCRDRDVFEWVLWKAAFQVIRSCGSNRRREYEGRKSYASCDKDNPNPEPNEFQELTNAIVRDWYSYSVPFADKPLGRCTGAEVVTSAEKLHVNARSHLVKAEFLEEIGKRVGAEQVVEETLENEDIHRIALFTGYIAMEEEAA